MKKWQLLLLFGLAVSLQDCRKSCDDSGYFLYGATANNLRRFSFGPGSYWIYADSASGALDSFFVYSYFAHTDAVTGYYPQNNCPIDADIADTRIKAFVNGAFSSYFTYYGHGTLVETQDSAGYPALFDSYYFINGIHADTLYQYAVLGATYPQVYHTSDTIAGPPVQYVDLYVADYIGLVKRVEHNPGMAVKTWRLLRSHLVIP